ncbi:MAG TPA: universal stress protein [Longimicrobium sp.]|nr:universal stress protein [Longimicrobium sp.]
MKPTLLRSILAATDLTVASDEALRAAAALAASSGAALHVVHAPDVAAAPHPDDPSFPGWISAEEERLGLQLRRVLPARTEVESRHVLPMAPHDAVLSRAAAVGADLVVLGPHRGRAGAAPLLGTTADRVVHGADCPCLVVRGQLALPLARIVVPIDLWDPSRGALRAAFGWGEALGARDAAPGESPVEIAVVHVLERDPGLDAIPGNRAQVGPRLHEEVEAARAEHGGVAVTEDVVWGDFPSDEIVRYAERGRADLVVLATHGRGFLGRALLGSVASSVAARATCPVLLVPPSRWSGERDGAEGEPTGAASAARATGTGG